MVRDKLINSQINIIFLIFMHILCFFILLQTSFYFGSSPLSASAMDEGSLVASAAKGVSSLGAAPSITSALQIQVDDDDEELSAIMESVVAAGEKSEKEHQEDVPNDGLAFKDMKDFLEGKLDISWEGKKILLPLKGTKAYDCNQQSLKEINVRSRFRFFKAPQIMHGFSEGPVMMWQILKPFSYASGFSGLLIHYVQADK